LGQGREGVGAPLRPDLILGSQGFIPCHHEVDRG
jgi:hypothetical protein